MTQLLDESAEAVQTRVTHHRTIFENAFNLDYRPLSVVVQPIEVAEPILHVLPFFNEMQNNVQASHNEIEHFLTLPIVQGQIDPLDWWNVHRHDLPNLYKMARDHLGIQSTSVASERAFSGGRQTITDFRGRLGDDSVRELQCLKSWYKFFK